MYEYLMLGGKIFCFLIIIVAVAYVIGFGIGVARALMSDKDYFERRYGDRRESRMSEAEIYEAYDMHCGEMLAVGIAPASFQDFLAGMA